ncbi:MAG: amidohydrolase [Chitinophagaceae bacterium]|nr:amidohydrolase [Chitinophagaceae bacterium]
MSLTFTLVQTNLFWEDKMANLLMLEEKIYNIKEKTQIVVLPEMFSTGFSMQPQLFAEKMDGYSIDWMKRIASTKKIILTGSIIIEENGKYFNRLIWMMPNGQMGYYDKRHCFAYGGEDLHYTPGKTKTIAQVNGWKINLQICYDLRFPVWSRQQKNNLYDLIIYVANWPQKRSHAWKNLLMARAIENQCYVIGVNRVGKDGNEIEHSGDSMVINPLGEILYHKEHQDDLFTITLDKQVLEDVRNQFPFWKDADEFLLK